MTHSQKLQDFKIENCKNPLFFASDNVHSNAFYDGGLTVYNFVFSDKSFYNEFYRQRRDFSPEEVSIVEKQWLEIMTNSENFGKQIGLTKCTADKAIYLSQFIKQ